MNPNVLTNTGLWSPAESVESGGGSTVGAASNGIAGAESRELSPPAETAAAVTTGSNGLSLTNWPPLSLTQSQQQQSTSAAAAAAASALLELVERQVFAAAAVAAAAAASASAAASVQSQQTQTTAGTAGTGAGNWWEPSSFSSPASMSLPLSLSPEKPAAATLSLSRSLGLPLQLPLSLPLQLPLQLAPPAAVPQWPLSPPLQQQEASANCTLNAPGLIPRAASTKQHELFARNALTNPLLANAKVELLDRELWDRFHSLTCEMVITRSGRYTYNKLLIRELALIDVNFSD